MPERSGTGIMRPFISEAGMGKTLIPATGLEAL